MSAETELPLPITLNPAERRTIQEFWDSLPPEDQQALLELMQAAAQHHAALRYSQHDLPLHAYLVTLIMEQHKEIQRLRRLWEEKQRGKNDGPDFELTFL
jgi:hypothetical protein